MTIHDSPRVEFCGYTYVGELKAKHLLRVQAATPFREQNSYASPDVWYVSARSLVFFFFFFLPLLIYFRDEIFTLTRALLGHVGFTCIRKPIVPPDFFFAYIPDRLNYREKKSRAYTPAEQTTTAISAVRDALDNLDHLFGTIEDTYRTSLMSSGIEREPAPNSGASSRKEFSA